MRGTSSHGHMGSLAQESAPVGSAGPQRAALGIAAAGARVSGRYSLYRHSTQGGAERPNVEGHELVREGSSLGLRVFQRLGMCDALRCVVPQRPVRPGLLVSTSVSGQLTTIIGHRHRHRHHLNLQLLKRASPHPEKTDDALGDKPTDGPALMRALRFPSLSFPMCTPPAPLASLCPSTSLADLADRTMQ